MLTKVAFHAPLSAFSIWTISRKLRVAGVAVPCQSPVRSCAQRVPTLSIATSKPAHILVVLIDPRYVTRLVSASDRARYLSIPRLPRRAVMSVIRVEYQSSKAVISQGIIEQRRSVDDKPRMVPLFRRPARFSEFCFS